MNTFKFAAMLALAVALPVTNSLAAVSAEEAAN